MPDFFVIYVSFTRQPDTIYEIPLSVQKGVQYFGLLNTFLVIPIIKSQRPADSQPSKYISLHV